jgi:hypothetical protein
MYNDEDLNLAAQAGALDKESVQRFQEFIAQSRQVRVADEERFRLVSSFNDIFVLIASCMLMLGAAFMVGRKWGIALCIVFAWILAEIFTRKKRMSSPSIVYALVFSIAPAVWVFSSNFLASGSSTQTYWLWAGGSALSALCAFAFWKRFQVPISVSLVTGAMVSCAYSILSSVTGTSQAFHTIFFLAAGLAVFALAMRYDMKDTRRTTVNADIAFWLHLLAGSLLVHTLFQLLVAAGLKGGSVFHAVSVLVLFLGLMLVAIVIDRRATLVSAAIYVITVLVANIQQMFAIQHTTPIVFVVVGSFLLLLSWGWGSVRRFILGWMPTSVTSRVPAAH